MYWDNSSQLEQAGKSALDKLRLKIYYWGSHFEEFGTGLVRSRGFRYIYLNEYVEYRQNHKLYRVKRNAGC